MSDNPKLFYFFENGNDEPRYDTGTTLRDLFAAAALNGWLSGPCAGEVLDEYQDDQKSFLEHQAAVAKTVYEYADALLAERAKGGEK